MIKRTIDISDGPTYLSIRDNQLVLTREKVELATIACEDVGLLLIDNRLTTYSHGALTRLLHYGAAIVLCGDNHLPCGLLLPMENNGLLVERMRNQVECKLPVKKRLWQQIVRDKVRGQARNLRPGHPIRPLLEEMAAEVRSGDPENIEGQAARFYWPALLGAEFLRDPDADGPNAFLNYGYAIFRAAIARAIVSAGLHPAFGLHHRNRSNAFCLADDLVEVFRPRVDAAVVELLKEGAEKIDKTAKAKLLSLLTVEICIAGQSGPLMVGLHRMVASLVRCYSGDADELELPELP